MVNSSALSRELSFSKTSEELLMKEHNRNYKL